MSLPAMTPEWSDGKFVSILVDLEADPQGREYTVGMVTKNPDNSWTAYDCTRANDLGTTSLALGDRDTRIAAKNLVEECFRTPRPEGSNRPLKADFTSNPWSLAVEKRWSEICNHLEAHIAGTTSYSSNYLIQLIAELNSLYVVTQYAGSNTRTGWLMAVQGYLKALGMTTSGPA